MDAGDYISMGMRPNGKTMLRVQILRWLAKLLRVQFKIGGQPYGASFERAINHAPYRSGYPNLRGPADRTVYVDKAGKAGIGY